MQRFRLAQISLPGALLISFALSACSDEADEAPGAVSEGEAQALEEAATMLDETRAPVEAIALPESEQDASGTADSTGDGPSLPEQ
ncbi:MAG: hypothetical protein AAGK17_03830 [Pseudomonadota bacterium]